MIPEKVSRLTEARERARSARDFAAADRLREEIRSAGFEVRDTPSGPQLTRVRERPAKPPVFVRSEDVEAVLDRLPGYDASVQWVVQGWPEDVDRGIESFRRYSEHLSTQHVIVEAAGIPRRVWGNDVEVVHVDPAAGWAVARNAGLRRAAGHVVILVDGSIEATGDVVSSLVNALRDHSIGITGPFGLVTEDLHDFSSSPGPEVDAVEGHLMGFRRELAERGLGFDPKFKFYRSADIELSFQIKDMGLKATVTEVPVVRHDHRTWANTPEDQRERLSRRNFYRFLDRWRGRSDLTIAGRHPPPDAEVDCAVPGSGGPGSGGASPASGGGRVGWEPARAGRKR